MTGQLHHSMTRHEHRLFLYFALRCHFDTTDMHPKPIPSRIFCSNTAIIYNVHTVSLFFFFFQLLRPHPLTGGLLFHFYCSPSAFAVPD